MIVKEIVIVDYGYDCRDIGLFKTCINNNPNLDRGDLPYSFEIDLSNKVCIGDVCNTDEDFYEDIGLYYDYEIGEYVSDSEAR